MSRPTDPNKDRLFWLDYETTGIDLKNELVFPIEVGIIITDTKLNVLEKYSSYINNDVLEDLERWADLSDDAVAAYKVHRIRLQTCKDSKSPAQVAMEIIDLAKKYKSGGGRVILISDNIQFEWKCTEKLINETENPEWPWHYCGWDTSILELVPSINFTDPEDLPHVALEDVETILKACKDTGKIGI